MRPTAVNWASLLAIAVASVGAVGCSERTLLQVDITGDRRFEDVVLRLSASRAEAPDAPREADFLNARFDTTNAYKAGLYLPAGWSGTVTVAAKVIEGACEIAAGSAIARDIQAEESSAVVPIVVVSHSSCIPVGDGSAGGSGGASGAVGSGGAGGAGGLTGAGGGAAGARGGAGGTGGAGGAGGSGGGVATGGASGGRAGAGGDAGTGGGTAGAAGGQAGTVGGAGAGGRAGTGGAAGAGGGIAGASGMAGGAGGAMGGTFGGRGGTVGGAGAGGGAGGAAGRGGTGGAGGCSQSNADACGVRNCGSVQNICGQVVPCGICRADQCCELGVCGPAGNPPRC